MGFIGNLLWIILGGGIFISIYYILTGIILCITIIGIPFGLQCFKLSHLSLIPFNRDCLDRIPPPTDTLNLIMNILWIIFFGLSLALTHLLFAFILAITIIGLPFAAQHIKLVKLSLIPFGQRVELL